MKSVWGQKKQNQHCELVEMITLHAVVNNTSMAKATVAEKQCKLVQINKRINPKCDKWPKLVKNRTTMLRIRHVLQLLVHLHFSKLELASLTRAVCPGHTDKAVAF